MQTANGADPEPGLAEAPQQHREDQDEQRIGFSGEAFAEWRNRAGRTRDAAIKSAEQGRDDGDRHQRPDQVVADQGGRRGDGAACQADQRDPREGSAIAGGEAILWP